MHGTQRDPAALHRIFYTTRFGRTLDTLGYVRFRHWRIYGERGLSGKQAAVCLYGETLLLEFSDEPLAQYSVARESDRRSLKEVVPRQLFDTQFRSPQPALWELGEEEWLKVLRVPSSAPRRARYMGCEQGRLFAWESA